MTLKVFTESAACTSGLHCATCRDTGKAGTQFRAAMGRSFQLPPDAPDFACPQGKPFTKREPAPSRGLGDTIARITKAVGIKPCGGCQKRRAMLNALVPYGTRTSPRSYAGASLDPATE